MMITVNRDSFLAAISRVSGAIDKRQSWPILASIKVEINPLSGQVTGSDMEIFATADFSSEASESCAFCVDFEKIKGAVSSCPDESFVLSFHGNDISIVCGGYLCDLCALPASEFPAPEKLELRSFTLSEKQLFGNVLSAIGHAASVDDTRHHLCGVYLVREGDRLVCVATDGHRLSIASLSCPAAVDAFSDGVIIPNKVIGILAKINRWSEVSRSKENLIRFTGPSAVISARLIDHQYVDYRRVISNNTFGLYVDSEELIKAIAACGVVSDDRKHKSVTLETTEDFLVVSGVGELGRTTYRVPYHGDSGLKISINGKYLSQALAAFGGEVCIKYTDHRTVLQIYPIDHGCWDERIEVIMPIATIG